MGRMRSHLGFVDGRAAAERQGGQIQPHARSSGQAATGPAVAVAVTVTYTGLGASADAGAGDASDLGREGSAPVDAQAEAAGVGVDIDISIPESELGIVDEPDGAGRPTPASDDGRAGITVIYASCIYKAAPDDSTGR